MKLTFYKFQGTGNDFVMVDNRQNLFDKKDTKLIAFLCDRRFGVGADGLILLENEDGLDFKMVYFNSDGNESTMCGNGGRCLVSFANYLGIIENSASFNAIDGLHKASIKEGLVSLQMKNVSEIKEKPNAVFLDTGSPHHVQLVANLKDFNVKKEGARLRYGVYGEKGSNINFVEQIDAVNFSVRTYERGVEDETLSCGTGVTAAAIAMHKTAKTAGNEIYIKALGGDLTIRFDVEDGVYSNVFLTGPAKFVFKGEIDV
ncbi:diaminopimelate epimerase [Cellulophaga sp. E16_2]|uniref:Diaminopimelate epimerase n=1 Tax=Cellulophaga algicola (strain DSM 14237 / IC166 / ACAM 630) TaxID=688270 RepID=E6X5K8_CELAD|nr:MULTISPECIES: diaminopimelate epimerase [Cellulophaga]ADV47369.1 Diaminopimelate epimerase [Cellulophaga algicola DSM 14237]MBO0593899.1 diaminopimelate epimerase [Cellulophaga sp. E16_2]